MRHRNIANTTAINTHAFSLVGEAIELLTCRDGIVAVVGPPGTGKSYATRLQLTLTGAKYVAANAPTPMTPRQLQFNLLAAADATIDPTSTETTLRSGLDAALASHPLVVIDNAHKLDRPCLKLLRRLHLGPDTTCPLLLVGEESLARDLASRPWTRRAILDVVHVEPLDRHDLAEVLPHFHPLYRDGDLRALLWIDRTFAEGRWANWARVTAMASRLHRNGTFERLDLASAALILAHVQ